MDNAMIMILAIIQARDSFETITELNKQGFYVTELSTTGGFLKQKNATLLIGTEVEKKDQVYAILKEKAGQRQEADYSASICTPSTGYGLSNHLVSSVAPTPVMRTVGGVTTFVVDLKGIEKF